MLQSNDLKDIFNLNEDPNYREITILKDEYRGFSVQRFYPQNISFKPTVNKNGEPDSRAIIYITAQEKDANKIPLFINIRLMSKYLSNHSDYDFTDNICPTEDSVIISKKSRKPIELESSDYFYDYNSKTLRDRKNRIQNGSQILDSIFEEHINTAKPLRGFVIHGKIGLKNISIKLIGLILLLLINLLKIISGKIFEPKHPFSGSLIEYAKDDMKLVKTDYLDIFGYKASKNLIVTFSFICILFFLINPSFPLKDRFIHGLKDYNLLLISFTIFSLWILDVIFPTVIFLLINMLIKLKMRLTFLKLKTSLW